MKISVVIPCYNKAPFVATAIQSVLDQTHDDTEVIVVDDGSSDGSWSIIQSFSDAVQSIRQENQGACHARNQGGERAAGDALMFLDADDALKPDTLSSLADTLRKSQCDIAACPWNFLVWNGRSWVRKAHGKSEYPPQNDYILGWLTGWFIPCHALLWDRETYEATGGWDENIHANQDGDIVFRALLNNANIKHSEGGLALYRDFAGLDRSSLKTKKTKETVLSRARVLERLAERLDQQDNLDRYAEVIGRGLHTFAKQGFSVGRPHPGWYTRRLSEIAKTARDIAGLQAITGTMTHRLACSLFGLRLKEEIAHHLAKLGIGSSIRRAHEV